MIHAVSRRGTPPLGLLFGGLAVAAGSAVWALGLDRLPVTLCMFKALTGLPCPTCGSTRVLGHLAAGDLIGAVLLNPLAALASAGLVAWAVSDLVLAPSGRSLAVRVSPGTASMLRWGVAVVLVLNWVWLVASGV